MRRWCPKRPGTIVFRTTQPLPAYGGLTVAPAFPKGVVDPPSANTRLSWWLQDWGAALAGILSLAGVGWFYFRSWLTVGRGPRAGPVVPLFAPPNSLSAAAVRYIARMRMDNRAFTAAIVELGVRKQLRITKEGDGWFSKGTTTLDRTAHDANLPAPEQAMIDGLFAGGDTLELKQANHTTLQGARSALESGLETAYCGPLFQKHGDVAGLGLLVVIAAVVFASLIAIATRAPVASGAEIAIPLLAATSMIGAWWLRGVARRSKGAGRWTAWIGVVVLIGFGLLFAFAAVVNALNAGKFAVLLPLLALPVALTAFRWMYAPTVEGRRVMDQIAGFKHYLGITEENRLEVLHPPEKTPELFETIPALCDRARRREPLGQPLRRGARSGRGGGRHGGDDGLVRRQRQYVGRPGRLREQRRLVARQHGIVGRDIAKQQQRIGRRRIVGRRRRGWRRVGVVS